MLYRAGFITHYAEHCTAISVPALRSLRLCHPLNRLQFTNAMAIVATFK